MEKPESLWQSWDEIPSVRYYCAIHSLFQAHHVLWAGYVWLHFGKGQDGKFVISSEDYDATLLGSWDAVFLLE